MSSCSAYPVSGPRITKKIHLQSNVSTGVGALEFVPHPPSYLSRHASFLFSFLGRGIFYIFVGSIILEGAVLRKIAGSIVGGVGLGYVALEFVPSIEPPPTMREAESTWGSEEV
ncbi:hypothetical protein ACJ72_04615 [Emergomyces africanus]|uniref:Golgi apparatus membrane protein TVP15 n=1 Tax=Emergomyces africanus TaxID=1955775 RepID=A0A1B7NWA2_9EURO|nr:hypothetical protein ACJ72_04615 [Emergomyces africanus]